MNFTISLTDFVSISPLWILMFGALISLLLECFSKNVVNNWSYPLTAFTFIVALVATIIAPISENQLLTFWIRFDLVSQFFTIFFLTIGLACTLLASTFFQRFTSSQGEYYFLLLSAVFGLILIGDAADFLTLFLGLETLSIALYVLCSYMKKWDNSAESAIKYFFIGAVASSFLLYGIALIYGATGTTQLNGLLEHYKALTTSSQQALFLGGIAFVTAGLAFKAAIVPFHTWAPDVYDGASTPVTAFMAVGTKVGAFAAFARIFLVALPQFNPLWNQIVSWLAIITLVYANILALRQVQLRRFFAYSGISNAGFLLFPIVSGTSEAFPSLAFYLLIYSITTLGSFAIIEFLDYQQKGVFLNDLKGLFQRSPYIAGIFALCLLTLAGIPPTAGFFAKFYIFKLAFQQGFVALVIVGLLTTILSIFYYLRIISIMFSEEASEKPLDTHSWQSLTVGIFSFAAIIILSIYPEPFLRFLSLSIK